MLIALTVLTVSLRLWRLDVVPGFHDSEMYLVPAALNYEATGQASPDNWYFPPLRHILMYWSISIFGNNPYGWRMRNALFGILTVLLLYWVGKEVFRDRRTAFLAALLLSVDALHLRYSRVSHGEIVAAAFFLAAVYSVLRASRGSALYLPAAGILLGLASAVKWYFFPAHVVLFIFAFSAVLHKQHAKFWPITAAVLSFTILPFCIYTLTFYQWFGRGYGFSDFISFHFDAYRVMQGLTLEAMPGFYPDMIRHSGNFLGWFTKPVLFGYHQWSDGVNGIYDVIMNNFPFVFLIFPSLAFLLYRSFIHRLRTGILTVVLFFSLYLQFIIAKRPIWIYSSIPLLPFAYLSVAFLFQSMIDRVKDKKDLCYGILVIVIACWGLYLFPFVNSFPVPEVIYSPLRAFGYIEKGF